MKITQKIKGGFILLFEFYLRINWIKTIWFNYEALPFKQAIFLPFVLSFGTKIKRIGKIRLVAVPKFGMIRFGISRLYTDMTNEKILFSNNGIVEFHGYFNAHMGVKINVRHGLLSFGNRVKIGNCNRIVCTNSIIIGDDFRFSWNGQMFDTDFHFLYNIEKNKYYPRSKPIRIGNNVFVGNHCTISKGSIITDGSVISCCTKVSGDYSSEGNNLLIMGSPGTIMKKGVEMGNSWFPEKEMEIAKLFNE